MLGIKYKCHLGKSNTTQIKTLITKKCIEKY